MANQAPGVYINVAASSASTRGNNPTGTWFVVGNAAGVSNIAVPINSIADFTKYFGQIVNGQVTGRYAVKPGAVTVDSTLLYDSLDVFFREGGINAYVSNVAPTSTGATATSGSNGGKFVLTANGKGAWANSSSAGAAGVILSITGITVNSTTAYLATIAYNGITMASSPLLGSDTDVINWVNSLPGYVSMVTASSASASSILPSTGSVTNIYLTGGTDAATADADVAVALQVFNESFGPGQVSAPGNTSNTVYGTLTNHAAAFNRVAILDAPNSATVTDLTAAATVVKSTANDPSYAGLFAPWLVVPGVVSTSPTQTSGFVFNRTVPPSAFVAANIAVNDASYDANVPAAGIVNGSINYAVNVTQAWGADDRGTLNAAGVNVIKFVPGQNTIAVYGFRSCAVDTNWVYLNNVRFRMQVIKDFDNIAESFVFQEIDGKGHIFSALNGALSGQCQAYWTRKSIYGDSPANAFSVNVGPQVNTPATIAAGQINAAVNLRMSPFGELVTVNVTKYAVTSPLPY